MAEIQLRGIEKLFDGVRVLESLDLTVPDGEFVVLLGPSGCGKTTALRIIAGLESPTAGKVHIGGRDVTRLSPRERDVAMVFQGYALYPHMSVAENIGYPLRIRGVPARERTDAVTRVADSLEVGHLLNRKPRQLSGGQRQRVALARAIIREPAAFLMDEPLSNLDAKLRVSMRGEIRRLQQRLDATTVYVTHDQAEAMTMADRVCLISNGVIQHFAPPQELFDFPANRFVAGFVGNPPMNILGLTLDQERQAMVVAGAAIPLGDRYAACAAAGVELFGIRARELALTRRDEPGTLPGSVYVVEPLGDETYVEVLIGETRVTVRADRGWTAPLGAPVGVRIDPANACFFDPSGKTAVHRVGEGPTTAKGGVIQ
jgi:multiple sugar transport system ATP-binding protein